jgi:ectoine hydroxylase-related dioxygenase (phytanoyl-CoA dioxygenase family)
MTILSIPTSSYGILEAHVSDSSLGLAVEKLKALGYAVIDSGLTPLELADLSNIFDFTYKEYIGRFGAKTLSDLNEIHVIRAPLLFGNNQFIELALNKNLIEVINSLIKGRFILNQQNGIINPPKESYSQSKWHRDLPYQHFTSSSPLALNAVFCIDDFTCENGATFVLPSSHKVESFPSDGFIQNNAIQIEARAGSFILLDSMVFHAGGANKSTAIRRAINHVYTIPYFKQQINIPNNLNSSLLSENERSVLGFDFTEPASVEDFLLRRSKK